eukprot:GHUV01038538.1.p1 GENE.GHUV01038538.1~~GHUV01038538.1.p1  ORF type:complete len:135 (-),score=12.26 GHUV01038538.1:541-945(-)
MVNSLTLAVNAQVMIQVVSCVLCQLFCNARACIRAHKIALMAQRRFWASMLRETVSLTEIRLAIACMERTELKATDIYRRSVHVRSSPMEGFRTCTANQTVDNCSLCSCWTRSCTCCRSSLLLWRWRVVAWHAL